MPLSIFNIHDLIEQIGIGEVEKMLHSFSCPLNQEIEEFLHDKALPFAKQKTSVTYLVFNEEMDLLGYFTLAGKILSATCKRLSKTTQKKILRYGINDTDCDCLQSFAYLL